MLSYKNKLKDLVADKNYKIVHHEGVIRARWGANGGAGNLRNEQLLRCFSMPIRSS